MEWLWMVLASALAGVISVVVVKRVFKALPTQAKVIVLMVILVVVALLFPHLFNLEGARAAIDAGTAQLASLGLSTVGFGAGAFVGMLIG